MIGFIIAAIVGVFIAYWIIKYRPKNIYSKGPFPVYWRELLQKHVDFYKKLNSEDQRRFEKDMLHFLDSIKITGADTTIEDLDRVLIAAGATIPLFHFEGWRTYNNLEEVLIYSDSFNKNFETRGEKRNINGMVGNGPMNGTMILSKKALHNGFSNKTDKRNVAVHEFVHLIDMMDGAVDGVPEAILDRAHTLPWIAVMEAKMREIKSKKSDIRGYGGTSQTEFWAVASEYFLERPALMQKKHPKLYALMQEMFDGQA